MKYTYDPATDSFTFTSARLSEMIRRISGDKAKIAEEDRHANVLKTLETRGLK